MRGSEALRIDDVVAGAVLLYCRRLKIPCHFERVESRRSLLVVDRGTVSSDPVLYFFRDFFWSNSVAENMAELWVNLCNIEDDEFFSNYATYVDSYFKLISVFAGRRESIEYIQPRSVTEIIAFYMKKYGVKTLYNPFAGLCSYPIALGPDCSFEAQEINSTSLALAKIRLHAHGLNPENVELEDSIKCWKGNHYDAVVASVPFGLRVPLGEISNPRTPITTSEDLFFLRSMGKDEYSHSFGYPKKMVATIVPQSFTTRPSSSRLREMMCKDGVLDTVIELPEGIFPNTSIRTSIVILSTSEKHDSVRFINVSSCLRENTSKHRALDWQKVISIIESENPEFIKTVSYDELSHQDYILYGDNYLPASTKCEDGHIIMSLSDLLERVPETRIRYTQRVNLLPVEAFSNKVLDILHPNTSLLTPSTMDSGYLVTGPCILFVVKDRKVLTFIHKEESPIAIGRRIYAYRVRSNMVSPEYLATYLVKDDIFCKQLVESVSWVSGNMARVLLYRNVIIADLPLQALNLKSYEAEEIAQREREAAAENARYQINKAGSDIAHMLGSVFKKQNELIGELTSIDSGTEKYQSYVTALIDTSQYINRVITAVGKDLAKARVSLKSINISDAISDYVRAWGNFSGLDDFILITQDLTQEDVILKMDIIFLRIMLDTLIDNAWRHGFDRGSFNAIEGNKVAIRISPVLIGDRRFIVLSVMNNGLPLSDGYSVNDYIERGNYKGNAGRTGLGGNHVYTIAQRHGGYLSLNSEQDWGFVVDILFPIENPGTTEFNTEYDGEYV